MESIKTYLPHLNNADQMLDYILDNGDTITDAEVGEKLSLMASMQSIQTKLAAVEKRMREEIAATYDTELGKSKTNSDKELGFKVITNRPISAKLIKEHDETTMLQALGADALALVFPAKRSFSKTGFNQISDGIQVDVAQFIEEVPGALSVKVTKIIQ